MTLHSAEVLPYGEAAVGLCRSVLAKLTEDDLERPTPCAEFTVATLTEHLERSMILLAGVAGADLNADPVAGPIATIPALAEGAIAAWRTRRTAGEVMVGRTITPAHLAAEIVTLELVVHAWDLARAVDADLPVDPEMCDQCRRNAEQLITPDKRGRAFALPVSVANDASAIERLVAFTGRTP